MLSVALLLAVFGSLIPTGGVTVAVLSTVPYAFASIRRVDRICDCAACRQVYAVVDIPRSAAGAARAGAWCAGPGYSGQLSRERVRNRRARDCRSAAVAHHDRIAGGVAWHGDGLIIRLCNREVDPAGWNRCAGAAVDRRPVRIDRDERRVDILFRARNVVVGPAPHRLDRPKRDRLDRGLFVKDIPAPFGGGIENRDSRRCLIQQHDPTRACLTHSVDVCVPNPRSAGAAQAPDDHGDFRITTVVVTGLDRRIQGAVGCHGDVHVVVCKTRNACIIAVLRGGLLFCGPGCRWICVFMVLEAKSMGVLVRPQHPDRVVRQRGDQRDVVAADRARRDGDRAAPGGVGGIAVIDENVPAAGHIVLAVQPHPPGAVDVDRRGLAPGQRQRGQSWPAGPGLVDAGIVFDRCQLGAAAAVAVKQNMNDAACRAAGGLDVRLRAGCSREPEHRRPGGAVQPPEPRSGFGYPCRGREHAPPLVLVEPHLGHRLVLGVCAAGF